MIAIGPDAFRAFLRGGQAMDIHFRSADWHENMPALLALTGIWHNQVCGHATRAVLPYDNRLGRLPAYLQQLEMESNGKRVSMDGADLPYDSGPVVWGEPGTNGQHAFYQLIHQGTRVIPCEFMIAARGPRGRPAPPAPTAHRQLPRAVRGLDAGPQPRRGPRDHGRQGADRGRA
jgi:glucose-6-phosphate isomerase